VQEVPGSNPGGPTKFLKNLRTPNYPKTPPGVRLVAVWRPFRPTFSPAFPAGIAAIRGELVSRLPDAHAA
jgi:hypothetical protein